MRPISMLVLASVMFVACSAPAGRSATQAPAALFFEGARLITGDGRAPIEDSAFVVEGSRITRIGARSTLRQPAGAHVIDLRGTTVMPALIDTHSHLGYTDVTAMSTSADHYTRETLIDHLQRYAYYGIGATLSLGLDRGELPFELQEERLPDTALFRTAGRGIAPPNAGPLAAHWRDAPYGVTTDADARAAVRELAARGVPLVKIWVDDRNGTVPKLSPDLYRAVIDEAHARGLRVVAHVYYLADAKDLLRAGVDGFAHGIRDADLDDEIMALFKERPQVFVVPNLPDRPPRRDEIDWLLETLPPDAIEPLRRVARTDPPRPALFAVQARNLVRLVGAGVRIGFGTDAGVGAPYGWSAHAELADMVAAGMTPAQAIVAATRASAEIAGFDDLGTIAEGKSADFIVLDANPLDDILHTRRISSVYLRGEEVDRQRLSDRWAGREASR